VKHPRRFIILATAVLALMGLLLLLASCGGDSAQKQSQSQSESEAQTQSQADQVAAAEGAEDAGQAKDDDRAATAAQVDEPELKVGGVPGNMAPEFALKGLKGEMVRLSELRGSVVIVDFWATWCGPCRVAMPHLQEIHETYGERGVTVVAIAMDQSGEKVVRPFVDKNRYGFKVVLPDGKVDRTFGGIYALPTTFIVAPDGTVYKKYVGNPGKEIILKDIYALKPELAS
jgi:thiol-disulfide isomerase/thioredoxin